ncbi:MAG: hypothetical protein R3F34_02165 [Planctomycetota bacterium]
MNVDAAGHERRTGGRFRRYVAPTFLVATICAAVLFRDRVVAHFAFFPSRGRPSTLDGFGTHVEPVRLRTEDGVELACYVVGDAACDRAILLLHGNAGHAGAADPGGRGTGVAQSAGPRARVPRLR